MANQKEPVDEDKGRGTLSSAESKNETGDPGRTPGTAEGDEQTVEEDLRRQEDQG